MRGTAAAEYALVSLHLKAEVWTKTETSYGELLVSCAMNRRVLPGQHGGGCEIRTREDLHPTRFPTMLASVREWPPTSTASANTCPVAVGERPRTGVNEPKIEPTAGSRLTRFRGLRTTIHHRPPTYLTSPDRRPAPTRERLWTGVNETQTVPRPGPAIGRGGLQLGGGR